MRKWKHSLCIQSAKVKERACSRLLWRVLWHMSRMWCEMLCMPRPGVKRTACRSGTSFCTAHAITATDTLNVVRNNNINTYSERTLPRADNLSITDTGYGTNWNYYRTNQPPTSGHFLILDSGQAACSQLTNSVQQCLLQQTNRKPHLSFMQEFNIGRVRQSELGKNCGISCRCSSFRGTCRIVMQLMTHCVRNISTSLCLEIVMHGVEVYFKALVHAI